MPVPLLPDRAVDRDEAPKLLLAFELDQGGHFAIEGEELLADPTSYHSSGVRNLVLTQVFKRLQICFNNIVNRQPSPHLRAFLCPPVQNSSAAKLGAVSIIDAPGYYEKHDKQTTG